VRGLQRLGQDTEHGAPRSQRRTFDELVHDSDRVLRLHVLDERVDSQRRAMVRAESINLLTEDNVERK
jgi:hypothetical protein